MRQGVQVCELHASSYVSLHHKPKGRGPRRHVKSPRWEGEGRGYGTVSNGSHSYMCPEEVERANPHLRQGERALSERTGGHDARC